MTHDAMKYFLDGVKNQYVNIIDVFIRKMPDDEFDKIPTISMTGEEISVIERYGFVFFAARGNLNVENYAECAIYSLGGEPFKIKKTNQ